MKKKKLTTEIHKFMDIEGSEVPLKIVKKLMDNCLYTYEDTHELKEHLYSIDDLQEKMQINKKLFSLTEKALINRIARVLDKADCGYFRFVFNYTKSPIINHSHIPKNV